jgi:hypothetical protein
MITLFRRKLHIKNRNAQQLAITQRSSAKVTSVYGRAVLHLNANQIGATYSYWLTMSRDDALALWAELDTFINNTKETNDDQTERS